MEENKQVEVSPIEETPKSLDEVIAGLRGFGIEENEEILTIKAGGRQHRLRISNIPTEAELESLLALDDVKGYAWLQRVKAEVLSRSISWIDGVNLKNLPPEKRMVIDPTTGQQTMWQPALRNVILTWGLEVMNVMWKVFMVHSQRIEDRLKNAFPDSAVMTEVEKRFIDLALQDIEAQAREIIQENLSALKIEDNPEAEGTAAAPVKETTS
jgi:hypothetical protein